MLTSALLLPCLLTAPAATPVPATGETEQGPLAHLEEAPNQEDRDLPDGDELLARVLKALGPQEVRDELEVTLVRGIVSFDGDDLQAAFREAYAGFDRTRGTVALPRFGPLLFGTYEGVVWEEHPTEGGRIKDGHEAAADMRRHAFFSHGDWRSLYASAEVVGTRKVGGGDCYEVRLVPMEVMLEARIDGRSRVARTAPGKTVPAPPADTLYVDITTDLPVRLELPLPPDSPLSKGVDAAEGPAALRVTYSDWREVNGLLYPWERRTERPRFTYVQRVHKIEHNPALAQTAFDLPRSIVHEVQRRKKDAEKAKGGAPDDHPN